MVSQVSQFFFWTCGDTGGRDRKCGISQLGAEEASGDKEAEPCEEAFGEALPEGVVTVPSGPALSEGEFAVDICKNSFGAGFHMQPVGRALVLSKLKDGPAAEWNETHTDCQMRVGDCIVRVNDVEGDVEALVDELVSSNRLRMVIRRSSEFQVKVNKGGGELGICVMDGSVKLHMLKISGTRPGVLEQWGRLHPDQAVRKGDCLLEVNGIRDDPKRILEELAQSDDLEITVCRPGG